MYCTGEGHGEYSRGTVTTPNEGNTYTQEGAIRLLYLVEGEGPQTGWAGFNGRVKAEMCWDTWTWNPEWSAWGSRIVDGGGYMLLEPPLP